MKIWMDVMRDLEHLMNDYQAIFDAWEEGGVGGLVIGPLRWWRAPRGGRRCTKTSFGASLIRRSSSSTIDRQRMSSEGYCIG